jgi:hypothetical protein
MKGILFLCFAIGTCLLINSCDRNGSASSEKKYDSLFLGIYLGMDKKDFYDHCWELNRLKVFTNGPNAASVEYRLANELNHPVMMRFYPDFYKNKIVDMPVTFSYESWAPWNKQYHSKLLLPEMVQLFEGWYGGEFKVMEHPTQGTVYYRMDGKRRINLFIRDDQFVQAVFTDLELERERKKESLKSSAK